MRRATSFFSPCFAFGLKYWGALGELFLGVAPKQMNPARCGEELCFGWGFFAEIVCDFPPVAKNGQVENKQNAQRVFEV